MDILSTASSVIDTALDVADRLRATIEVSYRHAVPGRRPAFLFSNTGGHDAADLVVTADLPVNFHPCDGRTQYCLPVLYAGERDHAVQFLPGFGHDAGIITLTLCYTDGVGSHRKQCTLPLY